MELDCESSALQQCVRGRTVLSSRLHMQALTALQCDDQIVASTCRRLPYDAELQGMHSAGFAGQKPAISILCCLAWLARFISVANVQSPCKEEPS